MRLRFMLLGLVAAVATMSFAGWAGAGLGGTPDTTPTCVGLADRPGACQPAVNRARCNAGDRYEARHLGLRRTALRQARPVRSELQKAAGRLLYALPRDLELAQRR